MPVYNANSLALYTLALSSRRFAAGSGGAKLGLIEIASSSFHSSIHTSSGSAKKQSVGRHRVSRDAADVAADARRPPRNKVHSGSCS